MGFGRRGKPASQETLERLFGTRPKRSFAEKGFEASHGSPRVVAPAPKVVGWGAMYARFTDKRRSLELPATSGFCEEGHRPRRMWPWMPGPVGRGLDLPRFSPRVHPPSSSKSTDQKQGLIPRVSSSAAAATRRSPRSASRLGKTYLAGVLTELLLDRRDQIGAPPIRRWPSISVCACCFDTLGPGGALFRRRRAGPRRADHAQRGPPRETDSRFT